MIISVPKSATKKTASQTNADPLELDLRSTAWELEKTGNWTQAIDVWQQILDLHYDDADAANELGRAYTKLGKHKEAVSAFERALQFRADPTATRLNLGRALHEAKKSAEAQVVFNDILVREPENVDALVGLSAALLKLKEKKAALATADQAVKLSPKHVGALVQLGIALGGLNRMDEALSALQEAVNLAPDDLAAGLAFGRHLRKMHREEEAATHLLILDRAHPDNSDVLYELAGSLMTERDYANVIDVFRRLLLLEPASATHYCNYCIALSGLDRFDEAKQAAERALAIEPNSSAAQFNLSSIYLTQANFDLGWPAYQHRFSTRKTVHDDMRAAPWCGEDLNGKSIIVFGEQGNGDYIQFIRYLSMLVEMGAKVKFIGPKRLLGILSSVNDAVTFDHELESDPRYDFQCHLISLPGIFHKLGLPIPEAPYLHVAQERIDHWRDRIGDEGLRVGVVWQGAIYTGKQSHRAFKLKDLAPLADVADVRLISLQVGPGSEQVEALGDLMRVETLGADFDTAEYGFIDAAAAMQNLDLIVTCDTSLAHLAGALGRPVWLALNEAPEWRWQRHREDTPWYATMRLFRQTDRGDWDGVFRRMAAALKLWPDSKVPPTLAPQIASPRVEVSWGEVVDKITILEIKAEKAQSGETRENVQRELGVLSEALAGLGEVEEQISAVRAQLRNVNETLWKVEDDLRSHEAQDNFDEEFIELARSVYKHNDKRATLKREINEITRSLIVEEKLYRPY